MLGTGRRGKPGCSLLASWQRDQQCHSGYNGSSQCSAWGGERAVGTGGGTRPGAEAGTEGFWEEGITKL